MTVISFLILGSWKLLTLSSQYSVQDAEVLLRYKVFFVVKVMVTLAFPWRFIIWSGPTCKLRLKSYQLFVTRSLDNLDHDLCPLVHLLVKINLPTKSECPRPKVLPSYKVILFLRSWPFPLRVIYWSGTAEGHMPKHLLVL